MKKGQEGPKTATFSPWADVTGKARARMEKEMCSDVCRQGEIHKYFCTRVQHDQKVLRDCAWNKSGFQMTAYIFKVSYMCV